MKITVFGQKVTHMQGTSLKEMRRHTILVPECTTVHEARFIIWQSFAATLQIGEFCPNTNFHKPPWVTMSQDLAKVQ